MESLSKNIPLSKTTTRTDSWQRGYKFLRGQRNNIHLRLTLIQLLIGSIPFHIVPQLRSILYRLAGFRNIKSPVYILDKLDLRGRGNLYPHLHIGEGTAINHSCHFDLNAPIYIGKNVGIGNNVFISTSTHIIGDSEQRCSKLILKPVTIGDGSWVGAYVIILAGVTIGPGTVVAAGSVVTKDIPANAQVAGNPARVIGWLNKASEDEQ